MSRLRRWLWFGAGWVCFGLGCLGIVVPGLPATVFFIMAAGCWAESSPRFERWLLDLPVIGTMVRDHRSGLGMPRRAKVFAVGTMLAVSTISFIALDVAVARIAIVITAAIGAWYVLTRVPTREVVLAEAAGSS